MSGDNGGGKRGTVAFASYGRDGAATLSTRLIELYEVVYAEPPYSEGPAEVAEFRQRLGGQLAQPGFALVAGWCGPQLAGYVFGFTLTPSCDVWDTILISGGPLCPGGAAAGVVYVSELLVRPAARRLGVATGLLDGLFRDRPERYAALLAHPGAAAAQATYARLGWRKVGWGSPFPGSARYETLVLDL